MSTLSLRRQLPNVVAYGAIGFVLAIIVLSGERQRTGYSGAL